MTTLSINLPDGCDFTSAFDAAVDWKAFETQVADLRDAKVEELKQIDPDYVPPAPRCPNTPDLFRFS